MNYYYDVVLNFLEEPILFYEWAEQDSIEYIKKIPLYQVTTEVFNHFYNHEIEVNQEFLKELENKTIKKNGKLKYACIIADKNSAYAYEFNELGKIITRSALTLKDEISLLDYLYTIPLKEINYKIITKLKREKELRIKKSIEKVIHLEIDKLYKEKYVDKLQFLHIEWLGKKEEDIEKIYKNLKSELKKDIDENWLHLYNIIKISYNNV